MKEGRIGARPVYLAGNRGTPKGRHLATRVVTLMALLAYCVFSWATLFHAGKVAVAWATKEQATMAQQASPLTPQR